MSRTLLPKASAAAFALVMVVAGCSSGSDEKAPVSESRFDQQRFDSALERLPDLVSDVMERDGIPGMAVAVVHGDKTVFAEGYGVREAGKDALVDPNTVFQIASVSKSVGATVVATQVTAGKLSWDDPVVSHLAGYQLSDPYVTANATVGDFYAHRTGLPGAGGDDLEQLGFDRAYILDHLRYLPLNPFRISYGYANFGTTTGAEAAASAAGTDWESLSDEALYKPLGMTSTSSRLSDFLARENRATLHAKTADGFAPLFTREPDPQSPAGGVSSNVNDLARWMSMILNDGIYEGTQLISPDALLPAVSAQITNRPADAPGVLPGFYGYGFNVDPQPTGNMAVGHSGAFFVGAATRVAMLPDLDVGIVVLTNAAPVGAAEALASAFLDLVQTGEVSRDWSKYFGDIFAGLFQTTGSLAEQTPPSDPAPGASPARLVGTYQNPYFGDLVITEDGGGLRAALGPGGKFTYSLQPWQGDTYAFSPPESWEVEGSLFSVTFDPAAGTVKQEYFDGNGLGTWTKSPA